jgi:micrococcal nuclease
MVTLRFLAAVAAFGSIALAAAPRSTAPRVIDGDTFDYQGERIRILDIDTPETHPARCPREAELGARATERLRQLLSQPFELQAVGRDEDRYGRKLRVVLVRGRSVGEQLVAEGLARRYEGRRQPWCGSASVG